MESSGQSQWELVSVVKKKQRGSHLRPDRLRLQNVDIVDKVRPTVVYPRRACIARVTVLGLSVCVSVCLCVCLTWILELQATKRHANGTLFFSAASARKIMWPIWVKLLRSGKRNRHRPGPHFVTQPINYCGAHSCFYAVLRCCKCYFKCR